MTRENHTHIQIRDKGSEIKLQVWNMEDNRMPPHDSNLSRKSDSPYYSLQIIK